MIREPEKCGHVIRFGWAPKLNNLQSTKDLYLKHQPARHCGNRFARGQPLRINRKKIQMHNPLCKSTARWKPPWCVGVRGGLCEGRATPCPSIRVGEERAQEWFGYLKYFRYFECKNFFVLMNRLIATILLLDTTVVRLWITNPSPWKHDMQSAGTHGLFNLNYLLLPLVLLQFFLWL